MFFKRLNYTSKQRIILYLLKMINFAFLNVKAEEYAKKKI